MARYKTVAITPDIYAELLQVQAEIVAERGAHVSMGEVIHTLITRWNECRTQKQ